MFISVFKALQNSAQEFAIKFQLKAKSQSFGMLPKKQKPEFIFVLGGPGAGKGTQCELMIEKFKFNHLSTGDLLRAEKATDSKNAKLINDIIAKGELVPSEILVELVKQAVEKKGNKGSYFENNYILLIGVFLLDGFPRNQENLDVWDKIMKDIVELKFLLLFECSEKCMEERLLGRAQTSGRSDDKPEIIKQRFLTFQSQTKPIIETYQGIVEKINAERTKAEIFEDVEKVMKKHALI